MNRSVWKGPFIEKLLLTKIIKFHNHKKKPISLRSRKSTILPSFVDRTFFVYTGNQWSTLNISDKMVGHKFGEFAMSRCRYVFKKKKRKSKSFFWY